MLGVDGHAQAQLVPQENKLRAVIGVAHARDGLRVAQLPRDKAAENVQFVRRRDGDHQIRVLHAGFALHDVCRAVAADGDYVLFVGNGGEHRRVRIDDHNVMSLRRKIFNKRAADLAAANDHDSHE